MPPKCRDVIDRALSERGYSLQDGVIVGLPEQPQERTFEDFNGEVNGQGEVEENQSQPPPPQRHPNTNNQFLVQSGPNPGKSFFSTGSGLQSSNLGSNSVPIRSLGQNQEQAYPQMFQQFLQQQQQQQQLGAKFTGQPNTQSYHGSGPVQLSNQQESRSNDSQYNPTNSIQNGDQQSKYGITPPQQQQQNNSRFMARISSTGSASQLVNSSSAPTVLRSYPQYNQVGSPNFPQPQQPGPNLIFCEPFERAAWEINKYRNKTLISEQYIYCDAYIYPNGIQYKVYKIECIPLRRECVPGIYELCQYVVRKGNPTPIQLNTCRSEYFPKTKYPWFNINCMCFIQNGEDIYIVTRLFAILNGQSVENRNPPPPLKSGPSIFIPYPFCPSYRQ